LVAAARRFGAHLKTPEPATNFALRLIAAACVIAITFAGVIDALMAIALLVAVAAGDIDHPLSLKNFFLGYVLLIFCVGGISFAHGDITLSIDVLLYVSVFLVGYVLISRSPFATRVPNDGGSTGPDLRGAQWLLGSTLAGWIALLLGQLVAYGLSGFYSGQALADRITRYGHADFVTGLMSAFEQGLSIVTVATAVYYIDLCVKRRTRPNYWLLGLLFLVMPIFLLRRADNALGTLFLLVVQPVVAGLSGYRYSVRGAMPLIVGSLLLSFASSVAIGSLREIATSPPAPTPAPATAALATAEPATAGPATAAPSTPAPASSPVVTLERTDRLFRGELSPIVAYLDIRENPSDFGYRLGTTIIPPLVLKVVPRSWLPDKPISSSAFYMTQRDPGAFAAGYAIPVTVFGDALLNFGYGGALTAAMILGVLAGRLDRVLHGSSASNLPAFLIVYYNFYSLLRNDLANSLSVMLLTAGIFVLLRQYRALVHVVRRIDSSDVPSPPEGNQQSRNERQP
jgi:hypothetical protein